VSHSRASCLSAIRGPASPRICGGPSRYCGDEHQASASTGSTASSLPEWSRSRNAGSGKPTGHPVSLLVFPSICFALWVSSLSATGRRPAFGCFLGFPPGLWRKWSPPLRAGLHFLDLPGKNLDGVAQAGSLDGGRRGGGKVGRGKADQVGGDEVCEPGGVSCSRRRGRTAGRAGETSCSGGVGGCRWGSSGSGGSALGVVVLLSAAAVVASVPPLELGARRPLSCWCRAARPG
jgi:hypothetical protein